MDLILIKPKVKNESDKYSWNLYKYLKKYPNSRVYYNKFNSFTDERQVYNKNKLTKNDVLIGRNSGNSIIGFTLSMLLMKVPSMQFWYQNAYDTHIDITEEFIRDYIEIGRCLFDQSHDGWLRNNDNRFTYLEEDLRKCNWCGIEQHKEVEEVIKYVEKWT